MRDEIGPGWFPDPAGGGGLRYWDGLTWTGFTQPPPGAFLEDQLPSSRRDRQTWPIAVLVGVVIATLLAGVITVVNHHSTSRSTTSTTPSAPPSSTANGEPALVPYPVRAHERVPSRASMPALYSLPGGDTVVTPESAKSVVATIWPRRAAALAASDAATLGAFETDSALAVDAARCDCGHSKFGPIRSVTVAVPRFSRFPANFLAEVSTTFNTDPWLALLVMTRASSDQPWRLAFAGGFIPASPFLQPLIGPDGYAAAIAPDVRAVAARQPAALAAYWQYWKDKGNPLAQARSSWKRGVMTDRYGQFIAQVGLQGEVNRENGLVGRYRYQADPKGTNYMFPIRPNEVLVCAPVLRQARWTGPSPKALVYQSLSRANWGPDVAPGGYRAMLQDDIASPCIDASVVGGSAVNDVVGIYPDPVASVGIR